MSDLRRMVIGYTIWKSILIFCNAGTLKSEKINKQKHKINKKLFTDIWHVICNNHESWKTWDALSLKSQLGHPISSFDVITVIIK